MVGYSDPCPCCGNKRRRSTLDRWATWPRPSSAAQHPPPAKFARSASDPTPSAVAAAVKENEILTPPVPALSSMAPPISLGCPTPVPTTTKPLSVASDSSPPPISPSGQAESAAMVRCPPAPGITEKEENAKEEAKEESTKKKKLEKMMDAQMTGAPEGASEKKEEKEGEMKAKAEVRVPDGVEIKIKICFQCGCGNSEEVIFAANPPACSFATP